MNKIFFLIWATPSSHQVILPIIRSFSKISKIYLFSSSTKRIELLDKKDSNFSKYCKHRKVPFFENRKFINQLSLIYFLLISFFYILLNKPKYVYIIDKYPLILTFFIKLFLNTKIIYHNLDYEPITKGFFQKIIKIIELRSVQYLDLLIFSHNMRAKKFFKDTKIKKKFIIFYNSLPKDFYKKYKKKHIDNIKKKKIFYFGSIGPGHGLFELIKSVKFLDNNLNLEIYGWVVDINFYLKIHRFIRKNNLDQKITIKLNVKDFIWKSKMIDAQLGVALYETKSLSHKFMFPASQKINAYLAACLPVLVSNTKDNKNFLAEYKCGVSTYLNPKLIAKNINIIFRSKKLYKSLRKNSKNAFLKEFNFEKQFQKIKAKIILPVNK